MEIKKKFVQLICAIIIFGTLIFSSVPYVTAAERVHPEKQYQTETCKGISEYTNSDDTRTDCFFDGYSIEYDFANKWYECLGQTMHYARLNNNKMECLLIVEKDTDYKYIEAAKNAIVFYELKIKLIVLDASDGGLNMKGITE